MAAPRIKGCRLKYARMGHKSTKVLFSNKFSSSLMLPNSSIYSTSMRSEGSIQSISKHIEGQESSYSLLKEGELQIFLF